MKLKVKLIALKMRGMNMHNLKNINKINRYFKVLINGIVIIFGFFVMVIPIIKTATIPRLIPQQALFLVIILILLFLPSIIYCVIAMKTKDIEYVVVPAISLLIAEYYFFHNFLTWISSDANAAIGLIIIPIILLLFLGVSYGIAFIIKKIKKHISRLF